jgi:hypothetical protein
MRVASLRFVKQIENGEQQTRGLRLKSANARKVTIYRLMLRLKWKRNDEAKKIRSEMK